MGKINFSTLASFGIGIAAGWFIKKKMDSPEFPEQKKQILKSVAEIREAFNDPKEKAKLAAIFGEASEDFQGYYHQLLDQLSEELSRLQISLADVDKQKYIALIGSLIMASRKNKKLTEEQVTNLTNALIEDFYVIKQKRAELLHNA